MPTGWLMIWIRWITQAASKTSKKIGSGEAKEQSLNFEFLILNLELTYLQRVQIRFLVVRFWCWRQNMHFWKIPNHKSQITKMFLNILHGLRINLIYSGRKIKKKRVLN